MPADAIREQASSEQREVHGPQAARRLGDARRELRGPSSGPGVSALKSWLPPTPSSGRIATASTMMPMPADQHHEAAPHVDRQRQLVEPGEHRAAGGREARHRLEVRVGEAQARECEQQRQRAERRQHDPRQRDQQEAVARLQLAARAARQRGTARRRAASVTPIEMADTPNSGRRRRPQANASGTSMQQREQHQHAGRAREDGKRSIDMAGGVRRTCAPTWNSFSTSRTMRLCGMNTMTWSSAR